MSENVHGHQKPAPFRTNEDNPIFGRQTPEVVPAEIPQGLHGAPALRSELTTAESPDAPQPQGDLSPALPSSADLDAVAEEQSIADATGTSAEAPEAAQDPIQDHEDASENVPDLPEVDTGASEPEAEEVSGS